MQFITGTQFGVTWCGERKARHRTWVGRPGVYNTGLLPSHEHTRRVL